jgi:hypothetical protein
MAVPTSPTTIALLRHLRTHGLSDPKTVRVSVRDLRSKTINNCVQIGHIIKDGAGLIAITPKGKAKLQRHESGADKTEAVPFGQPLYRPAPGQPPVMHSSAETDAAVLAVLRRATIALQMTDIARRSKLPLSIVRPAVTALVQAERVETSGKPDQSGKEAALYRLAPRERRADQQGRPQRAGARVTNKTTGSYTCPELQRNPGIGPERFVAFALPSRINNRLHWPDGRVTPVSEHPGLPA